MAEKKEIVLRAVRREGRGKNDARRARREGQVPVTIYGGAAEAVAGARRVIGIHRMRGHGRIEQVGAGVPAEQRLRLRADAFVRIEQAAEPVDDASIS